MKRPFTTGQPIRAKLIFNAESGDTRQKPQELVEVLRLLQDVKIQAEVFLVEPNSRLARVAKTAVQQGFDLVIACGGDGTVDSVAGGLVGTGVPLGVLPSGTRNNTARSLDVPVDDLEAAVRTLREGQALAIDVGLAKRGRRQRYFLEFATIGLVASLFPASDRLQKGDLRPAGEFLANLVTHPSAQMRVDDGDGGLDLAVESHIAVVLNLPMVGANLRLHEDISLCDGYLDLFLFPKMNKAQLIAYAAEVLRGVPDDPRVQRVRVRSVRLRSTPALPAMADGFELGEGSLRVEVVPGGLTVLAGEQPLGAA
jgi:diacylglycerol kinase (ATP)